MRYASRKRRTASTTFLLFLILLGILYSTITLHNSIHSNGEQNLDQAPILLDSQRISSNVSTTDVNNNINSNNNNTSSVISKQQEQQEEQQELTQRPPPPTTALPHPHAGARSANGSWGYVADVTLVRRWMQSRYRSQNGNNNNEPPPLSYLPIAKGEEMNAVCNANPREGTERKAGWRLLTRKVVVNGQDPGIWQSKKNYNNDTNSNERSPASMQTKNDKIQKPKILCAIYTHEKKHPNVRAIGATWGWRCDGFFAASTKTVDNSTDVVGLGSVDLPHEGPETYENMWMKSRSIWSYMHDHYIDDFDFFFLSGDDTHVIVENLQNFLTSLGPAAHDYPLYLGQWIPDVYDHQDTSSYFCGGGPGYILNKVALRILVQKVLPTCEVHEVTSAEDRVMGSCLRQVGIVGNTSVDATGAQRFHGMDPHFVSHFKGDQRFFQYVYNFWGELYGFKTGFNLTSTQSISFHLLKTPRSLKRHHAILYKSCPAGTVLGEIFRNQSNALSTVQV